MPLLGWVASLLLLSSLTRADLLDALKVPDGFTVTRVAGPPLVERPMLPSFDDQGRLYVADSAGVNWRGDELAKNPPHVIRLLEDTDGDGVFDKSHVFADKLVFPQGILWHDDAVYVSSPPSFWRLRDTNGNGVADVREELVTGFANTGVADDMHGASLGPDGRIYWFCGRFPHEIRNPGGPLVHKGTAPLMLRCKPDGSELEVVCGTHGNAIGAAWTPEGDAFACGTFLAPDSMGAGLRDAIIHCVDGAEYPIRDRLLNEHKRTGDLLPPLSHLGVAAASDLTIYEGEAFGPGYTGNLFSALFNMHKIVRHALERDGATFKSRNEDFLVSSHADFHPTDVFDDADGSLLVIDTGGWFRIGCPTSQIAKPDVKGAIYRVRKKDAPRLDDPRGLRLDWAKLPADKVVELLDDPRPAVSARAVHQLAKLGPPAVGAVLGNIPRNPSVRARLHAVWALTRIETAEARTALRFALSDRHPSVRQAAARSAGLHRDVQAIALLSEMVRTNEPPVRREAATALGRIRKPEAVPALLDGLRDVTDRFLEHSLIFALIQIADRDATLAGLRRPESTVKRGALIALDQMDGGNLKPELVIPFLDPADPLLQQTALWVIAHHRDWAPAMVGLFRPWLAERDPSEDRRGELQRQLLAFCRDSAVQELIADLLRGDATPTATRLLLLETIAQAPLGKLPARWGEELKRSLAHADERVVRQAVATVRAAPTDRRPVLVRADAQVNFDGTEGRFAGTHLSENFAVRWTGLLRVPKAGRYILFTESDDGSRLFIDGKQVVENGGYHRMREASGEIELSPGEHTLRLEMFQGGGSCGCKLGWMLGERKEIIPASALFHRASAQLSPGLLGEYFDLGDGVGDFPDLTITDFSKPLLRLAAEQTRAEDLRVSALAAAAPHLESLDTPLFLQLVAALDPAKPPVLRGIAAEALSRVRLQDGQLETLTTVLVRASALELPRLLTAYGQSANPSVGKHLLAALNAAQSVQSLKAEMIQRALKNYPADVREAAAPLCERLAADTQKQTARLAELEPVLARGEVQRGRDLFFGPRAVCATCHAVQGQGGRVGPDLTKIAAIRTGRDLLEAVVFPSASFARGYEPFAVTTRDGETHTGIITRETADAFYVATGANSEVRLLRSAIKDMQQGTVSLMPEGLDAQLAPDELGDLLAFLQSLK